MLDEARATVLSILDPAYGPKATSLLETAGSSLDELAWQDTAIEVIGRLRYATAARPLVKVLLTPAKGSLAVGAARALARFPVAAEPFLLAALRGTDPELARLAARFSERSHVAVVAEALAIASRASGRDAVLAALRKPLSTEVRVRVVTALLHFPPNAQTRQAYLDAYAALPKGASPARAELVRAASLLFDPTLVPWLMSEAKKRGSSIEQLPYLVSASLLMRKEDRRRVAPLRAALQPRYALGGPVADEPGADGEIRRLFDAASEVLDRCGADSVCLLSVLAEPRRERPDWHAVKAIAMLAHAPQPSEARAALVAHLRKLPDAETWSAAVLSIDYLTPNGDAPLADELDASSSVDREIRDLAERLRARAAR